MSGATDHWDATFEPLWDNREGRVNTYYVRPLLQTAGGRRLTDSGLLERGFGPKGLDSREAVVEAMTRTMDFGIERAKYLAATGDDARVIIPVNGRALMHRDLAGAFTAHCRTYDDQVTDRLIYEVTNVSDQAAQSHLDEVAAVLYLFCKTYGCRISPRTPNLQIYTACNYAGVALDMGRQNLPPDKVRDFLNRFVEKAEAWRLKAYLHGVADDTLRTIAHDAGVRFVCAE